jgi:hypothetical protein
MPKLALKCFAVRHKVLRVMIVEAEAHYLGFHANYVSAGCGQLKYDLGALFR